MNKNMAETKVNRRRIEAEENAVLDVQFAILDALRETGVRKDELAERLGVSKARVSQLFAAEANPTIKQVARIFDALDYEVMFHCAPLHMDAAPGGDGYWREEAQLSRTTTEEIIYDSLIRGNVANENYPETRAAA